MAHSRLLTLSLFAFALGVFLLSMRGVRTADNVVHAAATIGVVKERRLALPIAGEPRGYARLFLARGPNGAYFPGYPPGQALVALFPTLIGSWFPASPGTADHYKQVLAAIFIKSPHRVDFHTAYVDLHRDGALMGFALTFPLLGAIAVALFIQLCAALGFSFRPTAVGALVLTVATPLLVYAGTAWTQLPCVVALIYSALMLARLERSGAMRHALGLGVASAMALLVRVDQLPIVGTCFLIAWRLCADFGRRRYALAAVAVAPLIVAAGVLLLWNLARFGSVLSSGTIEWVDYGLATSHGTFSYPFHRGLVGLLFSPVAGLLWFSPMIVLSGVGVPQLWRRRRWIAVLLVAALVLQLLTYATWGDWSARRCYGPRYLLQSATLAVVGLVALWQWGSPRWRAPSLLLALLGVGVQIPGALIVGGRFGGVGIDTAWRVFPGIDGWLMLLSGKHHFSAEAFDPLRQRLDVLWWTFPLIAWVGGACVLLGTALTAACWRRETHLAVARSDAAKDLESP